MSAARVSIYEFQPEMADEFMLIALTYLLVQFKALDGFQGFEIVHVSPTEAMSISRWHSLAHAQRADELGQQFVRERLAHLVTSTRSYVGEIGFRAPGKHRPASLAGALPSLSAAEA